MQHPKVIIGPPDTAGNTRMYIVGCAKECVWITEQQYEFTRCLVDLVSRFASTTEQKLQMIKLVRLAGKMNQSCPDIDLKHAKDIVEAVLAEGSFADQGNTDQDYRDIATKRLYDATKPQQ